MRLRRAHRSSACWYADLLTQRYKFSDRSARAPASDPIVPPMPAVSPLTVPAANEAKRTAQFQATEALSARADPDVRAAQKEAS